MKKIENLKRINLNAAKAIASKDARMHLNLFSEDSETLDDSYLVAEHCWIFFKHPSIVTPKHILHFEAFAVSDQGESRLVYDLRDDPEKMQKHLTDLSNYFSKRNPAR